MPINAEYRGPADLPEVIPVFPLPGALLLPRGHHLLAPVWTVSFGATITFHL